MSVDTNPVETPPPQTKPAAKQYRKYEWPADRVTESQLNEMREVAHHLKRPVNQLIARAVTEFAEAVHALLPDGPMRADELQAIERGNLVWQPASDSDRSPREEDLLTDLVLAVEQISDKLSVIQVTVETLRQNLQSATTRSAPKVTGQPQQETFQVAIVSSVTVEVAESPGEASQAIEITTADVELKTRQLTLFEKSQFD